MRYQAASGGGRNPAVVSGSVHSSRPACEIASSLQERGPTRSRFSCRSGAHNAVIGPTSVIRDPRAFTAKHSLPGKPPQTLFWPDSPGRLPQGKAMPEVAPAGTTKDIGWPGEWRE